jgi:rfaE bifunctional protein nucleotidyltransferase chain/domain
MPITIVYTPGCWDLLHVGHINILQKAKALGDRLIVGVASDGVIEEDKGNPPVINLTHRLIMLNSLKYVDVVLDYHTLDFLPHLKAIRPDILAVGENWGGGFRHIEAEKWVKENNKRMVTLPYTLGISTTKIKQKIMKG